MRAGVSIGLQVFTVGKPGRIVLTGGHVFSRPVYLLVQPCDDCVHGFRFPVFQLTVFQGYSFLPVSFPAQPFGKLPYVLRAGGHPAIALFQIRGGKPVHVVGQETTA